MSVWPAEPVPSEMVATIRDQVGSLVAGIIAEVKAGSPVYREVLEAPEGMALRLGIEQALRAFLDAAERGERPPGDTDELWQALGGNEFQAGRRLEDLRHAFRLGIRAAWHQAAEAALRVGVSAPVAVGLAETIFVYADDLATDVVEGYLRMQSDRAGERERRRRRLAGVLLDPAGHDPDAVARAAELAEWPVPRELAVVAVDADDATAAARRLSPDALVGADDAGAWLLVPDPDGPGRAAALDRALEGERAAVGPTAGPAEAHRSLRWARLALGLHRDGALGAAEGPVHCSDHLAALILLQDRELAGALAAERLAALDELAAGERERLLQTLAAWLDHQRHTPAVAEQLHVHPQTVRYRVARLRELLGDAMDAPDRRFGLELAVRIERALGR